MRASATLAQRTGLPRGRALAELLGKFARMRPSDSPEANRARTEAARAAKVAKRAAKAEPAAEPTTPDAT